jgi:hypothetical protein
MRLRASLTQGKVKMIDGPFAIKRMRLASFSKSIVPRMQHLWANTD